MNVKRRVKGILRRLDKYYPWASKLWSYLRIFKYDRHIIPEKEIVKGEQGFDGKKRIIEKYTKKWPRYMADANQMVEQFIGKIPFGLVETDKAFMQEDMLFCYLAYGFLPEEYLCFHLADKSVEQKMEFISDIDKYRYVAKMNNLLDYDVFMDKSMTYERFKKYYKRDAIAVSKEDDFELFQEFTKRHPIFVSKQVFLSKGDSVTLVNMKQEGKSAREVFHNLIREGKHICEELVIQSNEMACLSKKSVNTVRCMSFLTKNGVEIGPCFLKMGRGENFVDNAGAGGIVSGIDRITGKVVTDGFDEFSNHYIEHPDTHVSIKGFQLPEWDNLIGNVKEMAMITPTIRYIGWDMAYTRSGWVVIEGNGSGQFIIPQIVWQKGFKAEIEGFMRNMRLIV